MLEEQVDDFIGQRFGEGGHLEVIGWDGVSRNTSKTGKGGKRYSIKCSICCKDSELFGDGIFRRSKGELLRGNIPCGCGAAIKWTPEQNRIRAARLCAEKGYTLLSFVGKTAVVMCKECGHVFERRLTTLVNSACNCSNCVKLGYIADLPDARRRPDEDFVEEFLSTGRFLDGTKFWREGTSKYWSYTCPRCSNDLYAQEGLCSGVFVSDMACLKRGSLSCRCSSKYRWTRQQREYQIQKTITDEGLSYNFVGWANDLSGERGEVILSCAVHGKWKTTAPNFINNECRCPDCAASGFKVNKTGFIYVLKVHGKTGDFTGYGITNKLLKRFTTHKRKLKEGGFSIFAFSAFKMSGEVAAEIEKVIKEVFPIYSQEVEGFKTEATLPTLYNDVVNFVKEVADKHEQAE